MFLFHYFDFGNAKGLGVLCSQICQLYGKKDRNIYLNLGTLRNYREVDLSKKKKDEKIQKRNSTKVALSL